MGETVRYLRCPLCLGAFSREGNSLRCARGHCYDLARQGYVNLAPGRRDSFYKKEMFESRARVFEAGVFEPVAEELTRAFNQYVRSEEPVVLDAGCGEGYYLRRVAAGRKMTRIGLDLNRDAVRLAAKSTKDASFAVGDLAAIPLADGCCDAVLDIFTPANYAQFKRVLKPGGVLFKIAPRSGYLVQLRRAARGRIRSEQDDEDRVGRYARRHMRMLEQRTITYTMPVSSELAVHLAQMTPMLAEVDVRELDLSDVREITIDETLYIGTLPDENVRPDAGK